MDKLELRMYGLVPYNISPIQQGIQFQHATTRYGRFVRDLKEHEDKYNDWADKWETSIILNGGTTNNRIVDGLYVGTLNNHKETLDKMGVLNVGMIEPDLGDQLTAVVFLVDERVFNKEKYPDWNEAYETFGHYIYRIGGTDIYDLREFLKQFRKA